MSWDTGDCGSWTPACLFLSLNGRGALAGTIAGKSQEQLDQEAAAIKIQAAVRGRQVRRVHANDKKSAEEKLSELTPDENYAHSSFAGGFCKCTVPLQRARGCISRCCLRT